MSDDTDRAIAEDLERIAIALERLNDQMDTVLEAKGYIKPQL